MQLAIAGSSLHAEGLDEAFKQAKAIDAAGIEVDYQSHEDLRTLARKDHAADLVALAEQTGLAVASLSLGELCNRPSLIGPPSHTESACKIIRRAMDVATQAGIKTVIVPFFGKNTIELETELNHAMEALSDLVEPAEQADVVLGMASTLNFDQLQYLMDYLGHTGHIRICLDTGVALARKLHVATGIRELGADALAQIHLKDVHLAEGQPPQYDIPLGEGNVDFDAVGQALRAIGYEGWVVVNSPAGAEAATRARANLATARRILGL